MAVRLTKRRWIAIVVTLLVALACAAILCRRDRPPPDDSGMAFVRRQPPPGQNGWDDLVFDADTREALEADADRLDRFLDGAALVRDGATDQDLADAIAERLAYEAPPDENWNEEDNRTVAEGLALPWNDAEVAALLEARSSLLERIDRCLAREDFVIPPVESLNARLPSNYMDWRRLLSWAQLRFELHVRAGELRAASDDVLLYVRLAQRVEDGQGSLTDVQIGATFKSDGLELARHLASDRRVTAKLCTELARRLAPFEMRAVAMQTAVREEYRVVSAALDDAELLSEEFGTGASLLVQPNETRRWLLPYHRKAIEIAGRPFRGVVETVDSPTETSWLNHTGAELLEYCGEPTLFLPATRFWDLFQVRGTRVVLALRAYEIEHGRLPDDLDALTLRFIDELPADPLDGAALRYSAEERCVWSVGSDLEDDGGDEDFDLTLDVPQPESRETRRSP